MPNIRPINKNKYQISRHRFFELYHFCLQYNEWKEELANGCDTVKNVELIKKCEVIEETALETDKALYCYILKAVTNERVTYNYLRTVMRIPCGKNVYYNMRRKFYWILSKKM